MAAKKDQHENVPAELKDEKGEPLAAKEGDSVIAQADTKMVEPEQRVNRMSATEEIERQAAEQYARAPKRAWAGQHEEGPEEPRFGRASTHRSEFGRVVVLHEDQEYQNEIYKAGVQDLPLEVADHFIGEGVAFEPAGKKKGR